MKYIRLFLKEHKGKAMLAAFLLAGQVIGTLLIPTLIANIVDEGILKQDIDIVTQVGIQMLLVALLATLISICGSWITSDIAAMFGREMRSKLFRKVQDLSIQQFNELGVSSLITRSTSDITNLQQTLGMLLQMVAPAPIIVFISMFMTAQISSTIAMIQIVFMLLLLTLAALLLKKSNRFSKLIQTKLDHINVVVRESITGVRVIRAFGNEEHEEYRAKEAFSDYASNMIHLNRLFAVFMPVVWLLMGVFMVIVLALGGIFSLDQTMKIGQISAVSEYAVLTMAYLMMAVGTLTTLPKARACMRRLAEVLNTQNGIEDTEHTVFTYQVDAPVVEFRHVTFSYPGAEEAVIQDLSFSLERGQTTAIIGSTGSGKSTLSDLLLRLHDIQAGSIFMKGVNIRQLSQHDLRECIGVVPQKAFLFSGTIADNLRMGKQDASNEELWKTLQIAQAKEFVDQLPQKLQAPVSQGGSNFSGGQRQRLSIARALIKHADVYVFDDSFSALDVKTDATLRRSLQKEITNSAKLIIAQRISSIMDAKQILVLDEGRLVGRGTHAELLKDCQVYRAIAESQLSGKEVS